jgi:hypothetical protein
VSHAEPERIRIQPEDLFTPEVDRQVIQDQAAQRYGAAPSAEESRIRSRRLLMSAMVYMTLAGAIGAFVAWAIDEPLLDDMAEGPDQLLAEYLFSGLAGACIAVALAAAEGLSRGRLAGATTTALIGGAVGFGAGLVTMFVANILFAFILTVGFHLLGDPRDGSNLKFMAVLMLGRAPAWALLGVGIGIGMGVARRSKEILLNGVIGGAVGGLLGGMVFDPVDLVFGTGFTMEGGEAWVSRMVGLTAVGAGIGFFIALVERITRRQWVEMLSGPLRGKQFVLYRFPTVIGSSTDADIYLFKDRHVAPRHATITRIAATCEVQSQDRRHPVVVNGKEVSHSRLRDGDLVQIGETRMRFGERRTG